MPEVAAAVALPWGDAAPVQTAVALPWGDAGYVQTLGTPFTPIAPPPGATETGDGGLAAPLAIAEATRYDVTHTMSMVLDATGATLQVDAVTLSLDDGSVHWTLAGSGGPDLFPLFTGGAVVPVVTLTIDGLVWRFLVESVSRPRQFASDRVSFSGRSLAAGAAAPYELERNWIGDAPSSAAQIADGAQQLTGLALDWQAEDWFVPAGVLSFTGTPLGVVLHVAQAAGLVVTAHPSDMRVSVAPRYPILPDQWLCVPPDVQVHFNAVETESYERADQPRYDAVLVTGQQQGAFGVVRAAGTSGNRQAPMVTDVLLTDEPALRQRGQAVLGASGPQARVQRTLPVLTGAGQPGVIERGALVRFVDPDGVWAGVVRSVSVRASLPVVAQTVTVERHTETVLGPPDPDPIVFVGPIPDLEFLVNELVDVDLSVYWETGALPWSFSMREGMFPAGLSLQPMTGRLVGTALDAGAGAISGLRVRAQDAYGNSADSNVFSVTVTGPDELSALYFEGTPGAATYIDDAGPSWLSVGTAPVLSAVQARSGATSLYKSGGATFNAIRCDYGAINPLGYVVAADLVQADFTIRLSVWLANVSGTKGLASNFSASSGFDWNIEAVGSQLRVRLGGTNTVVIALAGTLTAETWHDVAMCRAGDTLKLVLDGSVIGTGTYTAKASGGGALCYGCGNNGGNSWAGYIDVARVSRSPVGAGGSLF